MDEKKMQAVEEESTQQELLYEESIAEETTEEPKVYTEAEMNARVDEVLGRKIPRRDAKIRKEFERKYGNLVDVLKAGTGEEDVEKITENLRRFYEGRGVEIRESPTYSEKDIEVLARAEADDIIKGGHSEVVEETDRLAKLGEENMSPRERAVFTILSKHRKQAEQGQELAKIGVTEDVYGSEEFRSFASQFNPSVSIDKIYNLYAKTKAPQKEVQPMGSMKTAAQQDNGVKEYYSPEEARKFTREDFDKNPKLFEAVRNSMHRWKK